MSLHSRTSLALTAAALLSTACVVDGGWNEPQGGRWHGPGADADVQATTDVAVINGRALNAEQRAGFRELYGVEPTPGHYWYDAMSGLWGMAGGQAQGFLLPGFDLGPLGENASGGNSAVVINGRRLGYDEVLSWQWMLGTQVMPGRYWLDHQGNYGIDGMPFASGNLMQLIAMRQGGGGQQGGGGGGGDNFWSTRFSAGNHDSSSGAGYVSVPGYGPVGYGM